MQNTKIIAIVKTICTTEYIAMGTQNELMICIEIVEIAVKITISNRNPEIVLIVRRSTNSFKPILDIISQNTKPPTIP